MFQCGSVDLKTLAPETEQNVFVWINRGKFDMDAEPQANFLQLVCGCCGEPEVAGNLLGTCPACRLAAGRVADNVGTLRAKWLDPKCHRGCQSLVLKQERDDALAANKRANELIGAQAEENDRVVKGLNTRLEAADWLIKMLKGRTEKLPDGEEITDLRHAYHVANDRIAKLESYLEKTTDGKLVVESPMLHCPECGGIVRQEHDCVYCDECPNPDDGCWPNRPPLPLFYGSCYAVRANVPPKNK
jgi:Zn finger protein HypA/HybF involved in hydrogenase expression